MLFFDRLALVKKCGHMQGLELTTRGNVLLLRQILMSAGKGALLSYTSRKNSKRGHHQGTLVSSLLILSDVLVSEYEKVLIQEFSGGKIRFTVFG